MIGVVSREPVAAAPYLEELSRQSRDGVNNPHGDGWGTAVLSGGHWIIVREQSAIWEGALGVLGALRGTIMLLHTRKASDGGTINITKVHPFCAPGSGSGIVFCQNGTINRHDLLQTRLPASAIDTEKYFDIVLRRHESGVGFAGAVEEAAAEIHAAGGDPTSLNSFISDGREFVAYRGRILPENAGYHTLHIRKSGGVSIVSTERFGAQDDWRELEGSWAVSP
jgi:predicted glutamine amidotransferase